MSENKYALYMKFLTAPFNKCLAVYSLKQKIPPAAGFFVADLI
jgi:hypothetical protein